MVGVQDLDLPRGFCKIARVMKLLTGKDGHHRGAVLKVAARVGQATTLQKPLHLLYPLEIHNSSGKDGQVPNKETEWNSPTQGDEHALTTDDPPTHDCEQDGSTLPDDDQGATEGSNSKRAPALKAQEHFKQWSTELLDDES